MTPRQKRFVEEYLLEPNASQAYAKAYGITNPNTAKVNGSKLLTNANIRDAIANAQNKRSERVEITADMILQRLWANAELAIELGKIRESNEALALCQKGVGVAEKVDHTVSYTPEQRAERLRTLIETARQRQQSQLPS